MDTNESFAAQNDRENQMQMLCQSSCFVAITWCSEKSSSKGRSVDIYINDVSFPFGALDTK